MWRSEKILFPPPCPSHCVIERSKMAHQHPVTYFPRGDELFLSVQTAQSRNYHAPSSIAIESCKSAIRLAWIRSDQIQLANPRQLGQWRRQQRQLLTMASESASPDCIGARSPPAIA